MTNLKINGESKWNDKIATLQKKIKELEGEREKANEEYVASSNIEVRGSCLDMIDELDEEIKAIEKEISQIQEAVDRPAKSKKVKKDSAPPKAKKVNVKKGKAKLEPKLAFQRAVENKNKKKTEIKRTENSMKITISEDADGNRTEREKCEGVMDEHLRSFIPKGEALTRIKEEELYRPIDTSFEQYLQRRWGQSRDWGCKLIKGTKIAKNIDNCLHVKLNECQARVLHKIHDDEKAQVKVVNKALKLAGEEKLTNQHIQKVLEQHFKKKGKDIHPKKVSPIVKFKAVENQIVKFVDTANQIFRDYETEEITVIYTKNLERIKTIIAKIEKELKK